MPHRRHSSVRLLLAATILFASLGAALLAPARPALAASATTTSSLNLRVGYRVTSKVKLVMPAGSVVEIVNRSQNGYWKVVYQGVRGYAHGDYLDFSGGGGTSGGGTSGGGATASATTTSSLNLRAGPSTGDRVLLVMPSGAVVSLSGRSSNGFLELSYGGTTGWASSSYLRTGGTSGGGSGTVDPGSGDAGSATTTTALRLRSGPSTGSAVLLTMPAGARVTLTGSSQGGFLGVVYNGTSGWASADYLSSGGTSGGGGGGGSIVWPMESGGTWTVIQGYNGGTHNGDMYRYSLDLAKSGGGTAGTSIYAPVSGTVLWNDVSSGGIAIDMGNGYTMCLFHVTFSGDLTRGTWVSQGQWLGTISGPGGPGYASTPHVDLTLWYTGGGGRLSTAFTGGFAISGYDFPESGDYNAYGETTVFP